MAETYYAWDPVFDCILDETDASGAVVAEYTQEPKLYGGLISQKRGSTTSYYHYDPVGTTRALTNQVQAITDTAIYTAFGELIASTGTTVNPFGFAGRVGYQTDSATSSIYIRARTYKEKIIRWLQVDPLLSRTMAYYVYSSNCPLTALDPSGLFKQDSSKEEMEIGPYDDKCASFYAKTHWVMDEGEKDLDFIILQKVRPPKGNWRSCDGQDPNFSTKSPFDCKNTINCKDKAYEYWEIWRVQKNIFYINNPLDATPSVLAGVNNSLDVFAFFGFDRTTRSKLTSREGKDSRLKIAEQRMVKEGHAFLIAYNEKVAKELRDDLKFGYGDKGVKAACSLTSACDSPTIDAWLAKQKILGETLKKTEFIWDCCGVCDWSRTLRLTIDNLGNKETGKKTEHLEYLISKDWKQP